MEFNLADLWECVADAVPGREAVVCGERRLIYAEVEERANRLAHHLAGAGVRAGDHVAVCLSNGSEYLEAMLAAFKLRAVPVNVNFRYVEDELAHLLDDSDAVAIVVHGAYVNRLAAVVATSPRLRTFVVVDDGSGADLDRLGAAEYEAAIAGASPTRDFGPRSADDHYILYTGGTTGAPKGVVWRAEDIFFAAFGGGDLGGEPITRPEEIADRLGARPRCLPLSPFMHGTAQWIAFRTLFAGGTVVISSQRTFDPVHVWELVAREQVAFLAIVGDAFARPLVDALDALPDLVDVGCCTVVLSGGATLSPPVTRRWLERLPGLIIVDGYGTSETGAQGRTVTTAGAADRRARFVVDERTTVLGPDLRPVPVGEIGRLATRGHIPIGYYKDPVATTATFPVVDGVRWSVPGDAARIEPDHAITVLGRGALSINTGGEKVHPGEVEAALREHPAVADALVVGLPDERWGERIVAVVELLPGADAVAELLAGIDEHLATRIARYKLPRDVIVVEHIVRGAAGKPDYAWARELAYGRIDTPV